MSRVALDHRLIVCDPSRGRWDLRCGSGIWEACVVVWRDNPYYLRCNIDGRCPSLLWVSPSGSGPETVMDSSGLISMIELAGICRTTNFGPA